MIQNEKVVTVIYDLFVDGENGQDELMERATKEHPLVYCQGEGMMLPSFETGLEGKEKGDKFEFTIPCQDAYGEYDTDGVMDLPKQMFYNGDNEFDSERVYVGNIIPMNTADGQIVNAQVVEITDDKVTIDLNHPLAGENLHFVGEVIDVRDVTPAELDAIRHPHKCGHCHGKCGDCGSGCGGNNEDTESSCGRHCGQDATQEENHKQCKNKQNGKHTCNRGKA